MFDMTKPHLRSDYFDNQTVVIVFNDRNYVYISVLFNRSGYFMKYYAICSHPINIIPRGLFKCSASAKKNITRFDIIDAVKKSEELILFTSKDAAIEQAKSFSEILTTALEHRFLQYTPVIEVILIDEQNTQKSRIDFKQIATNYQNIESITGFLYQYGNPDDLSLVDIKLNDAMSITQNDLVPKESNTCSIS